MAYTTIFKRYEIKYLLTAEQKDYIIQQINPYMRLDKYGHTTIRNIYLDTDSYRLIRRSLEKPVYKEKLRLRSYQQAKPKDPVFIELKKKYKSVVYKRRLVMQYDTAVSCFQNKTRLPDNSQIAEEIEYFRDYYKTLHPTVFLSYEREAYYAIDGGDLRITFDENILYRQQDLSLASKAYGNSLLKKGNTLMEIKTSGCIPIWLCRILTQQRLYKTSFSKYGLAYTNILTLAQEERCRYA